MYGWNRNSFAGCNPIVAATCNETALLPSCAYDDVLENTVCTAGVSIDADSALCGAVTNLRSDTACKAMVTTADSAVSACTYIAANVDEHLTPGYLNVLFVLACSIAVIACVCSVIFGSSERGKRGLRKMALHSALEILVVCAIMINTVALAIQHPGNTYSEHFNDFLDGLDMVLTTIFTVEMLIKIGAFGLNEDTIKDYDAVYPGEIVEAYADNCQVIATYGAMVSAGQDSQLARETNDMLDHAGRQLANLPAGHLKLNFYKKQCETMRETLKEILVDLVLKGLEDENDDKTVPSAQLDQMKDQLTRLLMVGYEADLEKAELQQRMDSVRKSDALKQLSDTERQSITTALDTAAIWFMLNSEALHGVPDAERQTITSALDAAGIPHNAEHVGVVGPDDLLNGLQKATAELDAIVNPILAKVTGILPPSPVSPSKRGSRGELDEMQDVCNKLIKEGLRPGQPKATNDQRDEISRQLEKLSDKQLILGSCVHGVDMDELEKVKVR